MAGQGRPRTSNAIDTLRLHVVRAIVSACALVLLICSSSPAGELQYRLRLAWGEGDATRWRGSISLSEGTFAAPVPLGIEPDESGSMWLEENVLQVAARSGRRYEGVDITVDAPQDAQLVVRLAADEASASREVTIPIAELRDGAKTVEIDDHKNRLVARRAPGDVLRVEFDRDHLVFDPGELFSFRITPHELGIPPDTRVELLCELRPARTAETLWSKTLDWTAPTAGTIGETQATELALPYEEGAYDLVITARRRSLQRLGLKQTITERRVQLVVIDPNATAAANEGESEPTLLEEIDPSGPKWWERLTTVPLIPGVRKGPLGSGDAQPVRVGADPFVALAPNASIDEVSWEAYPLPVKHPGQAHVLEIEFPSNEPQNLGISIVEPNAAGAVAPVGVDSGIYVDKGLANAVPGVERFRLTFWPRTKTPLVLMTNRSGTRRAVYGRIRLSEHPGRLPVANAPAAEGASRLAAAYYDRPLWPENFGASESLDTASGRSLKDWKTFHDGSERLLDYLRHTGRNALVAPAWSDGCALYPSELIESTPRYDNGTFFLSGQDPCRKDVLEMLFRMCDREGIAFVPMLDFSTPLLRLELARRQGRGGGDGTGWINANGERWEAVETAYRGQAPYYNALDPRVQEAMVGVVEELVERYGSHRSFAGVAVQLSALGYAQLPGPEWGFDSVTLAAFTRETGVMVEPFPASGAARESLISGRNRNAWLDWRASRVAALHHRMQKSVRGVKPAAKLYLTGAHVLERSAWDQNLQPKLMRRGGLESLWIEAGIAPQKYLGPDAPVLLRPSRIAPAETLDEQAMNLELNQAVDLDRALAGHAAAGAQFFHEPQTLRVLDFEKQSPFKSTYCWLVSQPTAVAEKNRRRFVHAVASLDATMMMDGGWLLPLGQDAALRDVLDAYRALPDKRFLTIPGNMQPIIARTMSTPDSTYLYLVNDSPWPVSANVAFQSAAPLGLESLAPGRQLPVPRNAGPRATWSVGLLPYDLVAVRLNAPQISIASVTATTDKQIAADLEQRVSAVWARASSLRNSQAIDALQNPGFEKPPEKDSPAPGWFVDGDAKSIQIDATAPHAGKRSALIASDADAVSLVGAPFAAPRLGRLQVSAWMRSDSERELPLQVVVEGVLDGQPFERRQSCPTVPAEWTELQFTFKDLPWEGVQAVRVRFEMLGAGRVWLDDVVITAPGFTQPEIVELGKMLQETNSRLTAGRLRDCQTLLEGYWPQFIERRVPLPEQSPVEMATRPKTPETTATPPAPKPGMLERLNQWMPRFVR